MKTLDELLDNSGKTLRILSEWAGSSEQTVKILPFSERRESVLLHLSVTTHSLLGTVAYETGGMLIADGWLRVLGSGSPSLPRDIVSWNATNRKDFLLIGDDVAGGFFALNTGEFGHDNGRVYYFSPDTLEWECLGFGYSEFIRWSMSPSMNEFYTSLRWNNWLNEIIGLSTEQCFSFYPFLWTREGSLENSSRRIVAITEMRKLTLGF